MVQIPKRAKTFIYNIACVYSSSLKSDDSGSVHAENSIFREENRAWKSWFKMNCGLKEMDCLKALYEWDKFEYENRAWN